MRNQREAEKPETNRISSMKHLPKIFLFLAVISFAMGASELGENWLFYLGRPAGAILFVAFMIFQFLKNESALYDEEQRVKALVLPSESRSGRTPAPGNTDKLIRSAA